MTPRRHDQRGPTLAPTCPAFQVSSERGGEIESRRRRQASGATSSPASGKAINSSVSTLPPSQARCPNRSSRERDRNVFETP